MLHDTLIALHAAALGLAFTAGVLTVPRPRPGSLFNTYLWSLSAGMLALAAAVTLDWSGLDATSRALFAALVALGAYLVWRAVQAGRVLASDHSARSPQYLRHVGFTLVALLDGFAVILALDLGAPGWALAAVGAAVAIAGHWTIATLDRTRAALR